MTFVFYYRFCMNVAQEGKLKRRGHVDVTLGLLLHLKLNFSSIEMNPSTYE